MVKRKVDVINEDEGLSNNGYARIAKALRSAEPSNPGGSSTGYSIDEADANPRTSIIPAQARGSAKRQTSFH